MSEQAEHTQVCEYSEGIFSSNLSQKWALPDFNGISEVQCLDLSDTHLSSLSRVPREDKD